MIHLRKKVDKKNGKNDTGIMWDIWKLIITMLRKMTSRSHVCYYFIKLSYLLFVSNNFIGDIDNATNHFVVVVNSLRNNIFILI